jgi:hypothetical protein
VPQSIIHDPGGWARKMSQCQPSIHVIFDTRIQNCIACVYMINYRFQKATLQKDRLPASLLLLQHYVRSLPHHHPIVFQIAQTKLLLKKAGFSVSIISRTTGGRSGCNWCSESRDCHGGKKKSGGDNGAHFGALER